MKPGWLGCSSLSAKKGEAMRKKGIRLRLERLRDNLAAFHPHGRVLFDPHRGPEPECGDYRLEAHEDCGKRS